MLGTRSGSAGAGLRRCARLALVLAATGLAGCSSGAIRRRVERRIERRLADVLGPAEKYRVRIRETSDGALVQGRARRVEVEGYGILARNQLLVDSLQLTLEDLRYEDGEEDTLSVRRSELRLELSEAAVNEYLQTFQARYQPEVRFEPEKMRVRLTYPFLGVPTQIRASGRLVVEEGRRLVFDADSADVSFINQPGFGERFVEDRVNPLLDLDRIDFPARLESVQIQQGRLKAIGTASLRREL